MTVLSRLPDSPLPFGVYVVGLPSGLHKVYIGDVVIQRFEGLRAEQRACALAVRLVTAVLQSGRRAA